MSSSPAIGVSRGQNLFATSPFSSFPCDYVRWQFQRYRENVQLFLLVLMRCEAPGQWLLPRDVVRHIVYLGHWPALVAAPERRQHRSADYSDEQLRRLPLWTMLRDRTGSFLPCDTALTAELPLYDDALLHRMNIDVYLATMARSTDGAAYIDFGPFKRKYELY